MIIYPKSLSSYIILSLLFIIFLPLFFVFFFPKSINAVTCESVISQDTNVFTVTDNCTFNVNPTPISGKYLDGVDYGSGDTNTAQLKVATGKTITVNPNEVIAVGSLDLTGGGGIVLGGSSSSIMLGKPVYVLDSDLDDYSNDPNKVVGIGTTGIYAGSSVMIRKVLASAVADANTTHRCKDTDTANTSAAVIYGQTCKQCSSGGAGNITEGGSAPTGQCVSGWTSCTGICTREGYNGTCDGDGACTIVTDNIVNGKVCLDAEEIDPSSTNYCSTVDSTTDESCSGTRYYRPCNGAGVCKSNNTLAASETIYAASSTVYVNTAGLQGTPSATDQCDTVDVTVDESCTGTRYYRACTGVGACSSNNNGAASATINAGTSTVYVNTAGLQGTPSATDQCSTNDVTVAGACSGTRYYRACKGTGTCSNNNNGAASTAINADSGYAYSNTTGSQNTTTYCRVSTGQCDPAENCTGSGSCNSDVVTTSASTSTAGCGSTNHCDTTGACVADCWGSGWTCDTDCGFKACAANANLDRSYYYNLDCTGSIGCCDYLITTPTCSSDGSGSCYQPAYGGVPNYNIKSYKKTSGQCGASSSTSCTTLSAGCVGTDYTCSQAQCSWVQ